MPLVRLENLQQFAAVNVNLDPGAIPGPKLVPSCYQVTLGFPLESGKTGQCILYGRYSGAANPTVALADTIFTALKTGAQWTALAGFLAPTTGFYWVRLRDVNIADQAIVQSSATPVSGSSASPALANEVAVVVTLRTAKVGPQNRGRMYIPGWATNALGAGNVVAAAAVTALQNWANTIPGAFSSAGLTWVIGQPARAAYTGTTGRQHPARTATSTPITSSPVRNNTWDTQRRRGLK